MRTDEPNLRPCRSCRNAETFFRGALVGEAVNRCQAREAVPNKEHHGLLRNVPEEPVMLVVWLFEPGRFGGRLQTCLEPGTGSQVTSNRGFRRSSGTCSRHRCGRRYDRRSGNSGRPACSRRCFVRCGGWQWCRWRSCRRAGSLNGGRAERRRPRTFHASTTRPGTLPFFSVASCWT